MLERPTIWTTQVCAIWGNLEPIQISTRSGSHGPRRRLTHTLFLHATQVEALIHVSLLKLAATRRQSLHAMTTALVALRFRAS